MAVFRRRGTPVLYLLHGKGEVCRLRHMAAPDSPNYRRCSLQYPEVSISGGSTGQRL